MNFSLPGFWLSLFAGLVIIGLVRCFRKDGRTDRLLLAGLSLTLLGLESWLTLGVFLFVFGVTYLALRSGRDSKVFLGLVSVFQLLPLVFYKYAPFVTGQVMGETPEGLRGLLIPVGLSFYTFQMVGLVVDTVKGKEPLPEFLDCLNFASFFPQIVAGPIERRSDLLPQVEGFRFRLDWEGIESGVRWIVLGLFMKLTLAENIAAEWAAVTVDAGNPFLVWLECVFFSFRIYYDFAGYSLIAFGLARCLGIRLTLNFVSPYWTTNFRDFWRRWHVSLSQWFRDYLYIPLGGNRSQWRWALILLVFAVSGVWHGAGWNFVLWGLLHGVLVLLPPWSKFRIPKPVAWGLHMGLVTFTWLFFFERDTAVLFEKVGTLLSPLEYSVANLKAVMGAFPNKSAVIAAAAILGLGSLALVMEGLALKKPYSLLTHRFTCVVMIVMIYLFQPAAYHEFIYFNF
ncbi:MAG: MBOAT family O-acyltransferase [Verrucomicrobiaceae bacterium]